MNQIQFWVVITSLLAVFPAHAVSPSSTHLSSEAINGVQFSNLIAQETPEPEAEAEPEPETPEPDAVSEPEPETSPETPEPEASPEPEVTPEPEASPSSEETQESPDSETSEPSEETEQTSELILEEQGELAEGDSVLASDGSLYDEYTFDGKEGQEVTISLDSSEFDTYLAIFTPDNKLLEEHDDVNQSNSNSEITVTLPSDGTYRVIVNSYDDKGRGKYKLMVK